MGRKWRGTKQHTGGAKGQWFGFTIEALSVLTIKVVRKIVFLLDFSGHVRRAFWVADEFWEESQNGSRGEKGEGVCWVDGDPGAEWMNNVNGERWEMEMLYRRGGGRGKDEDFPCERL